MRKTILALLMVFLTVAPIGALAYTPYYPNIPIPPNQEIPIAQPTEQKDIIITNVEVRQANWIDAVMNFFGKLLGKTQFLTLNVGQSHTFTQYVDGISCNGYIYWAVKKCAANMCSWSSAAVMADGFKPVTCAPCSVQVTFTFTPQNSGNYMVGESAYTSQDITNPFTGSCSGMTLDTFDVQQACTPNWQCSAWSTCNGGTQTRTCTDSNSCGTSSGKPSESQSCTVQCGASGQACCSGSACNSGLTCQSGTCQSAPPPCGSQGQVCCNGAACNSGLLCQSGTCQQTNQCGAQNQQCCGGGACNSGLTCQSGNCQPVVQCGGENQNCCSGGSCNSPLTCQGGTCKVPAPEKCDDGTAKNQCSDTKPQYCNADLSLINDCLSCGCPDESTQCQSNGKCTASADCPYECCLGVVGYKDKDPCPSVSKTCDASTHKCAGNVDPCPYDCCYGMSDYANKACPSGQACQDDHSCQVVKTPCPDECCLNDAAHTDKACTQNGYTCQDHACVQGVDWTIVGVIIAVLGIVGTVGAGIYYKSKHKS